MFETFLFNFPVFCIQSLHVGCFYKTFTLLEKFLISHIVVIPKKLMYYCSDDSPYFNFVKSSSQGLFIDTLTYFGINKLHIII